jgi:hypothetical protein
LKEGGEGLVETSEPPLPVGLTPHKLRHTYASILVALGVDPGAVMDELGHTDPAFTLRVYRHGMRRDPAARARLRSLSVPLIGHQRALTPILACSRRCPGLPRIHQKPRPYRPDP